MRPLRLDLAGFAVFREPTVIDFADADFFALVGPTGSGKSTVLDAICFALYGTAPRWNDRRAIANALAPSTAEARVRLIFDSGGHRYAATRVVRRDGKGKVSTTHAALEMLPKGFDLARLDSGLEAGDLGEPLAGTPAEMETAVVEAVGLPFDQFISCVVLPQGQFAEFLHAKPATRQQILVNLLGLHVYEHVREKATAVGQAADAQLAATDRQVAAYADADDAAIAEASGRLEAMRRLEADVDSAVPTLQEALRNAEAAQAALQALDADLARLSGVKAPARAADLAGAVATARKAAQDAQAAMHAAEEREESLRGDLAAAGDANEMRRLLDLHAENAQLVTSLDEADEALWVANEEHAKTVAAYVAAQQAAEQAAARVTEEEANVEAAQTADRAATLRPHLVEGEPCPVCLQVVAEVPVMPEAPKLAAARAKHQAARDAAVKAAKEATARDRAVRDLERALAGVDAQREQLAKRAATIDAALRDAPGPEDLRKTLRGITELQLQLDAASSAVTDARAANRRATVAAQRANEQIVAAWKSFDATRDALASFAPPPADRDDLAGSWISLAEWAANLGATRLAERAKAASASADAVAAVTAARRRITTLFEMAGVPASRDDEYGRATTLAVEQARAAHARLLERRAQADKLRAEREQCETEARVAKALAQHLRANNFERWLLVEALDTLVDGASAILRELSGGQYDLTHDKGEFYVVDHHDAALARPVRTLSGGETFQASLSLALALSEQLAGLSTAAASLESIVLDEGFGTLDGATLDTVAATLENLAARGDRMVGVVTHVSALAERVPVRFEVRKDTRTARVFRTG
jgi:DNA repair protein SbcC/Rad50